MSVNTPTPKILQSQRSSFFYLEYCRVHMDGDRLVYSVAQGAITREWNIPTANTSILMLGSGCSITQAAARKLSSEKTLVAFTGGGGFPIFMGATAEYAPTEHLINWIKFWPNEKSRLAVAKYLNYARCDAVTRIWPTHTSKPSAEIPVPLFRGNSMRATSIEQLRGFEGEFAKSLYKEAARATKLLWNGRQAGQEGQDIANSFLDQGNYLAYGAAGTVLWALGIPPGLAVNHGATRAGGLVFDLADTIKDAIVLPIAFECASSFKKSQEFRENVIQAFDELNVLVNLFDIIKNGISEGIKALE